MGSLYDDMMESHCLRMDGKERCALCNKVFDTDKTLVNGVCLSCEAQKCIVDATNEDGRWDDYPYV